MKLKTLLTFGKKCNILREELNAVNVVVDSERPKPKPKLKFRPNLGVSVKFRFRPKLTEFRAETETQYIQ